VGLVLGRALRNRDWRSTVSDAPTIVLMTALDRSSGRITGYTDNGAKLPYCRQYGNFVLNF
jgi:hypothetical protein